MAAGLGFKEFTTGDVLTAADANGYLASQVVMVFASAAARTSAIASPQEGMISYLKDTNATEYYSGSAWVAIGGGGASGGMTLINTGGTTLTGSTTSITSIPGTYNELIIYVNDFSASTDYTILFRFNADNTGSNYQQFVNRGTGASDGTYVDNSSAGMDLTGYAIDSPDNNNFASIYVPNYASSIKKVANSIAGFMNSSNAKSVCNNTTYYFTNSAVTEISFTTTAGTFSGGTVYVYGVK
jgi:hypothetical protein